MRDTANRTAQIVIKALGIPESVPTVNPLPPRKLGRCYPTIILEGLLTMRAKNLELLCALTTFLDTRPDWSYLYV